MPKFQMIKYHNKIYPPDLPIKCEEIAGNFDVVKIDPSNHYSLHTEYSYGKRNFQTQLFSKYTNIYAAQKEKVPMLWYSMDWAREFASFIIDLTAEHAEPKFIEIHPPFSDYTASFDEFLDRYTVFEQLILAKYPNVSLLIENRCGSLYHGGKFVLSNAKQLIEFANLLEQRSLALRITLDLPQLYTAYGQATKDTSLYCSLLESLHEIRSFFNGVHLWGKRNNSKGRKISHVGDLNSYFDNNQTLKREFLISASSLFDDDKIRNMVLEVNSGNEDMLSIIRDLRTYGFYFV